MRGVLGLSRFWDKLNGPKNIALGLFETERTHMPLLEPFARQRGSIPHWGWEKAGLVDGGALQWERTFDQAIRRSPTSGGKIEFNLDGLDIQRALSGRVGIEEAGMTSWELRQILGNSRYYENTNFYLNGVKLEADQLRALGLGFTPVEQGIILCP